MLFRRLIWTALGAALLVGSLQTALQQWQAVPLLLAAEAFEQQAAPAQHAHEHDAAPTGEPAAWAPADGLERTAWTWVANVLYGFAMALLVYVAMCLWVWRRGPAARPVRLGLAAAAAGWLSFYLWPSLGLPAQIPGMEAGALGARQLWWALAAACALAACASVAFGRRPWHWLLAACLLALPHVLGAPKPTLDPLAGFGPEAQAQLRVLHAQFRVVAGGLSVSLWLALGLACGWLFGRWLAQPLARLRGGA